MLTIVTVASIVLAVLALCRLRWAYFAFIALGLLYFPVKVGFHLDPQACEVALSRGLMLVSFSRVRDLIPDMTGAALAAALVFAWTSARRELGVRLERGVAG